MTGSKGGNPMTKYLVIPAYEPDQELIKLVEKAYHTGKFEMIVVNDGSSEKYDEIFREVSRYAAVLKHEKNRGKGAALKTAYAYIRDQAITGIVVTADADGQHSLEDILSVAVYSENHPEALVLGQRTFRGNIPLKSRFGNLITRYIFWAQSQRKVEDTQTGLRAFSTVYLPFMMRVEGDRYEYEMNVLLFWAKRQYLIREIPIETIYRNGNRSSHFRPVQDAWRIYKDLFKFGGVSMLSFLMDYGIYSLLVALLPLTPGGNIVVANTAARCVSGTFNFEMNRRYVFRQKGQVVRSGIQYLFLAIGIYLLSTGGITVLYELTHVNPYLLKILVDAGLFFVSWYVQKHLIFAEKGVKSFA